LAEEQKTTNSGTDKSAKKAKIGSLTDVDALIENRLKQYDVYSSDSIKMIADSHRNIPTLNIVMMVDSGCTNHTFGNQNVFHEYTANSDIDRRVQMADNSELAVTGRGSVSVKTAASRKTDSVVINLRNSSHVPQLSEIFFSVSAAADNGIVTVFDDVGVYLYAALDHTPIAVGYRRRGTIFPIWKCDLELCISDDNCAEHDLKHCF
jgi:hypothetical protein